MGLGTLGFETVSLCIHAHNEKDIWRAVFAWLCRTSLVIDKEAFQMFFQKSMTKDSSSTKKMENFSIIYNFSVKH